MKNKLNGWKIAFLLFLAVSSIYIIRNNYIKEQEKSATRNWQKHDKNGQIYSSAEIEGGHIQNRGKIFGTEYCITYRSQEDHHENIREELFNVDNSLSPFNKKSLISAVNENRDTIADKMFAHVFNLACEVSQKTGGAFDITVAPLVNAWGFGFRNSIDIDSATIDSIMEFVGYRKVALTNGRIVKEHPQTLLDCSAIAKGYGCDIAAETLAKKGVTNYLVEIGGEVVAGGKSPKGKAWAIGISKPIDDRSGTINELQTIIKADGTGIATSGNYRNYREVNGRKVAHTIDPLTGYPVKHSLLSATVIADNCATADAYATAFMVTGTEKAIALCDSTKNLEGYFIYADENGSIKTASSKGFRQYIIE